MSSLVIPQSVLTQAGLYPMVRSGLFVSFEVLDTDGKGKWTILLEGKRLQVSSDVILEKGRRYGASLHVSNGQVRLKLDALSRSGSVTDMFNNAAGSKLSMDVVRILTAAALPLRGALVDEVVSLLRRFQSDRFGIRLISLLLGKDIDPGAGNAYHTLLPLFDFGGDGGQEKRRQHRRRRERAFSPELLKEVITDSCKEGSLLTLFNQLKGRGDDHWMLFPLPELREGKDNLSGVLRIRFKGMPPAVNFSRAVLDLRLCEAERFFFIVEPADGSLRLSALLPEDRLNRLDHRLLADFQKKLDNLGIRFDDIKSMEGFDGCDFPDEKGPRGFDALV